MPAIDSRLTLGLDIGSASIGWALVDLAGETIVAAGVRIFPAGADLAEFDQGKEGSSNNTVRRTKRLQRRQFRRRTGRQKDLFLALQGAGLLPETPADTPGPAGRKDARHAVLSALDLVLRAEWAPRLAASGVPAPEQVLPYFLRAVALDEALPLHALGRALYHLGQRRGFQSVRRELSGKAADKQKAADEKSAVKAGIGELEAAMQAQGARSLAEHFVRLDPAQSRLRGPSRWTSRGWFKDEFEAIWQAQAPHHPQLTPELKKRLVRFLFFQRPIKAGTPGKCELESGARRAPMASLLAQRFRLLQKVNDLRLAAPDGAGFEIGADERERLIAALEREGDLSFNEIDKRKLVRLPKGYRFNLQQGGEKKMPGNRTHAALAKIFGDRWGALSPDQQGQVISQWLDPNLGDAAIARLGRERYGLSDEACSAWQKADPEDGYAKLSLRALRRLLPLMERGVAFKTAEKQVYGDRPTTPMERLPPVDGALPAIANPCVMRALTELRKIVNAIVAEHGKPWEIRIELARDLKRNAEQRSSLSKRMRDRESARKKAAARIAQEAAGVPHPSAGQITKVLLWEKCGQACPYCGGSIGFEQLFADGQIEIDHILPRSRFPDDSFGNKCVAHTRCNREKLGRTPFEAFSGDAERWEEILNRVRAWKDAGKLSAFECRAEDLDLEREDSFASRRLNETRYTTTQAAQFLGLLYGGRNGVTADGRRAVVATSGMATATLRRGWELESILGQAAPPANGHGAGKPRHDHRHHAIDAIVVALTSNTTIQRLSLAHAAAAAVSGSDRVSSRTLQAPWNNFVDSVRPVIASIRVSHRARHALQGELFDETNYGKVHDPYAHVRKPVHTLTGKQPERIVDPVVRRTVEEKIAAVGDVKKLERDPPMLHTRSGREVPIRRVRLQAKTLAAGLKTVGSGHVNDKAKHHIALFAGRDRRGRDCWYGEVVSRFEAMQRKSQCRCGPGQSCGCIVRRVSVDNPEAEFLFSLMGGDTVEMATARGADTTEIYVVRTISESELAFVRHVQAAKKQEILDADKERRKMKGPGAEIEWTRISRWNELLERRCQKIVVDVLGRTHPAAG